VKRASFPIGFSILLCLSAAAGAQSPAGGWENVDKVFGRPGRDQPGDVHKFSWPRSDLQVLIGNIPVEPALALGSWAAFKKTGTGQDAMTMGDLVLLGPEVAPVVGALEDGGFEILAIHNHLLGETPRVMYVHFHARGDAAAIAKTLEAALEKTKTPLLSSSGPAPAGPTARQEKIFQQVQDILGRKGSMAGVVLQFGVPRSDPIQDSGMDIPPSMGMATAINFETVEGRVATTGDLVLIADEVNPVIRELRVHGIEPTALHSHMLRETPRLFFLHFWGVGPPEKMAEGLKAALAKTASRQ
jgi:uncharacterized protein DUF1259